MIKGTTIYGEFELSGDEVSLSPSPEFIKQLERKGDHGAFVANKLNRLAKYLTLEGFVDAGVVLKMTLKME